jgi:drug/metabolite transporter (DMT)-like permease
MEVPLCVDRRYREVFSQRIHFGHCRVTRRRLSGDMGNKGSQTNRSLGRESTPLWLRLAPAIFLVLWSAGFSFVKIGLAYAEPITFLLLRFVLVVAVLLPVYLVLRPPLPRTGAAWAHLAVITLFIQVAYFGLCYAAIAFGMSAAGVALIVSLQPILVALVAPRLATELVGAQRWAGLGLGFFGAVLVIVARSDIEAESVRGIFCAIGALLGMTAGAVYEKRFNVSEHPVTSNLVQNAFGIAAVLPVAWIAEDMHIVWTGELVLALGYLVIANSLISLTLLVAMIRRGEVSRVSALFFLVPPTSALIAWALIGEVMPWLAWVGTVIAALGVAIASRAASHNAS